MKNILSLTQFNKQDVNRIFEVATQMRHISQSAYKKNPQLSGWVVGGVWNKPCVSSTAFGFATNYLCGSVVPCFGNENPFEQCTLMDNMGANAVVVSCDNDNLLTLLSAKLHCALINGGSNKGDPVGVLADLFALYTKLESLQNLTVLLVGNRDTNKVDELIHVLRLFNSSVVWYLPQDDAVARRRGIVFDKIDVAFGGVDAVIDLGLAPYSESEMYYGNKSGIPLELMEKACVNAPLLGSKSVVNGTLQQEYENNIVNLRDNCYVSVAMALLYLIKQDA